MNTEITAWSDREFFVRDYAVWRMPGISLLPSACVMDIEISTWISALQSSLNHENQLNLSKDPKMNV